MEIRDVVDSDWAAIWGFMQQILDAGGTYCWPTNTSEEGARAWWMDKPGGRVLVAVDDGHGRRHCRTHPNQPAAGAMSPTRGSWSAPQPGRVWDAPWPTTSSK